MSFRVVPVVLFLACLPWLRGSGQPVWTLEQCVAIAKEHSLALRSANNFARTSELSQQELATTKYPQVKLGALAIYAPTFRRLGYDPAISNGGEYAAQLFVQQSVYDGGLRGLRADQLRVDIEQRRTEIRRTERDIVFSVRQGYIDLLRAQREGELVRESVAQLEDYLELVTRLAKGGSASSTDVLKTQIQLANARLGLQRAMESSEASTLALKESMGVPSDTAFALAGTLQTMPMTAADSPTTARPERPESNLELMRSAMEVDRSLIDVEVARQEMLPAISLIADAGLATSGENLRLPQDEQESMFGFSVGVAVELPLLNWGATALRVQQKLIGVENVRLEHQQLLRTLDARTRMLRLQLSNAGERLRATRLIVAQADDNFLLTKAKYATGSALSLEVLAAQQLLTESKLSETQALADLQIALARIDQLLTQ